MSKIGNTFVANGHNLKTVLKKTETDESSKWIDVGTASAVTLY